MYFRLITLATIWRECIEEVSEYEVDNRGGEIFRKVIGIIQEQGIDVKMPLKFERTI